YAIPEELGRGSLVGPLARDLGLSPADLPARQLRLSAEKQYFGVSGESGNLYVSERLDREEMCGEAASCSVSFEALVQNPLNVFHVEVAIQDINDNAPAFSKAVLDIEISEWTLPGARFPLEMARDTDVGSNALLTYQLTSNPSFTLAVKESPDGSKQPELVLERALDREKQSSFQLVLTAVDGGDPVRSGTVQVHVNVTDANDNAPVFSKSNYEARVRENLPAGSLVLRVRATDADAGSNGRVSYSFGNVPDGVRALFSVDSDSGEVRTAGPLDFEEKSKYSFALEARDGGGLVAHCKVQIDITDENDNAPEITMLSVSSPVPEDAPAGTVVALLKVRDRDSGENGQVSCELSGEAPLSIVASSGGSYKVVTASALDNDNAPLVLYPSQDSSPASSELVPKSSEAGYLVTKVVAVDADSGQNSWLSYHLLRATDPGLFAVGAQSGEVRLRRPVTERDAVKQKLVVLVRDNGQPPLSATAALSALLLNDFSDVHLPHSSLATEDEGGSLTTYLIISLVFVSVLFLASMAAFIARQVCKGKELKGGHVLYGTGNLQSGLADAAAAGTLPHAYCYEISLTTGSGNSEFKFLKPILPSLPPQHSGMGRGTGDEQEFSRGPVTMEDVAPDNPGTLSAEQFDSLSFN
ncbi:PREDICTED: protocadherin gamma-B2-like, partial [Haliaeetus leucocephalus]|uniref:protocadherin gamma-B2-like n=1 Tax=Haliaeetus leucocephalus TaxID=52644 RepID=UPI00053CC20C